MKQRVICKQPLWPRISTLLFCTCLKPFSSLGPRVRNVLVGVVGVLKSAFSFGPLTQRPSPGAPSTKSGRAHLSRRAAEGLGDDKESLKKSWKVRPPCGSLAGKGPWRAEGRGRRRGRGLFDSLWVSPTFTASPDRGRARARTRD